MAERGGGGGGDRDRSLARGFSRLPTPGADAVAPPLPFLTAEDAGHRAFDYLDPTLQLQQPAGHAVLPGNPAPLVRHVAPQQLSQPAVAIDNALRADTPPLVDAMPSIEDIISSDSFLGEDPVSEWMAPPPLQQQQPLPQSAPTIDQALAIQAFDASPSVEDMIRSDVFLQNPISDWTTDRYQPVAVPAAGGSRQPPPLWTQEREDWIRAGISICKRCHGPFSQNVNNQVQYFANHRSTGCTQPIFDGRQPLQPGPLRRLQRFVYTKYGRQ